MRMNLWYYFWILNFIAAGSTFAVISLIVFVRGLHDLRRMFEQLSRTKQSHPKESYS